MGIFDIFKRGADEAKDFIGGYVNDAVIPAANMVTGAVKNVAKGYVNEAVVPAAKVVTNSIKKIPGVVENKVVEPAKKWLNAVDETSQGLINRDDGRVMLTQDLPAMQQYAGAAFNAAKDIKNFATPILKAGAENAKIRNEYLNLLGQKQYGAAEALYKDREDPFQKAIFEATYNTEVGRKILDLTNKNTSITNLIPDADQAMKESPVLNFVGGYANALSQNTVGIGLALIPGVGKVLSPMYYASLSAYEQQHSEKGRVYSGGNIAIDTIGDSILGGLIGKTLGMGKAAVKKTFLKAFNEVGLVEGGTEVLQSLGKYANDYQNAVSDTERKEVIEQAKNYFKSGQILQEFGIGYLSGGTVHHVFISIGNATASKDKTQAPIHIPPSMFVLEEKKGKKYFETEAEAKDYVNKKTPSGDFSIKKLEGSAVKTEIDSLGGIEVPFVNGQSESQKIINTMVDDISEKTGLSREKAIEFVSNYIPSGSNNEDDDFFTSAVEQAKLENGQTPDIIQQAIAQAQKTVDPIVEAPIPAVDTITSEQYITEDEARQISKSFKFIEDLNIPLIAQKKILTPQGKKALGSYSDAMIKFVENPHETTISHEAVHAFLDLITSKEEKAAVINEFKRRKKGETLTDLQAEELLAQEFAIYHRKKMTDPNAKTLSNKIKQFFDAFIENIKKIVGAQSHIKQLYHDIETKRPDAKQKDAAYAKQQRGKYNVRDVQNTYYQEPDFLTTKFLQNVDVKNREVASYQFLKDLLKSKGLPLKETERIFIGDILDTQFKNEKKINMNDFRNAVTSELMPLEVITSGTHDDYGSENVGKTDDYSYETHIYNSPFAHGYSGHFSGDFKNNVSENSLEIKEIPGQNKWAVIKKGVELTEANIAENTLTVKNSEQEAKDWIAEKSFSRNNPGEENYVNISKIGLFAHSRVWDKLGRLKDGEYTSDSEIRHIAEIQSDIFQNYKIERIVNTDFDNIYREVNRKREQGLSDESINNFKQENNYDGLKKIAENEAREKYPKLYSFSDNWFERIVREEIRRAAMDDVAVLRFPTPYTIAKIEGYLSEEGQIPVGTAVGDGFDFDGREFGLLTNQYGETGKAIPVDDIRGTFDFDIVRDDGINNEIENVRDIAKENDNFNDFTDNYSTGDLSAPLIDKIKTEYEKDKSLSDNTIDDIANEVIDSRFTDAESFVEYYNNNIEPDFAFATEDNRVIFLNYNKNIETLVFGSTENDKEDFNYEELPKKQATVARFYDKQVGRYLAKLRKANYRIATDDDGYDWYETDITEDDRGAVEAFQTVESLTKPLSRTGQQVADYVEEVEQTKAEEDDEEEYKLSGYMRDVISAQDYELRSVKIKEIISADPDFAEYVRAGEQRYPDGVDNYDNIDLPIVIGNWGDKSGAVLDGYNRTFSKYSNGDQYVEAWVSTQEDPKYQEIKNIFRENNSRFENSTKMVARERFNIPSLEKVSFSGSDRDVYNLGDKVLKVAKTARGLAQNLQEGELYAPVPEVFEKGINYVVVAKAEKPNKKTKDLVKALQRNKNYNSRMPAVDMINNTANEYFNAGDDEIGSLIQDLNNYDIMLNDVTAIRNWGTIDGEPVLLDAGSLDTKILKEYEGKTTLNDSDFRQAYNMSKVAKKKYGDTDDKTKYQLVPSKMSDLEYRRDLAQRAQYDKEAKRENDIYKAREYYFVYNDSEKERGYQNFKDLAKRRPWVLDPATDDEVLKKRMPNLNLDNLLFGGEKETPQADQLEKFKDRYYAEQKIAEIAKEKTPSEISLAEKKVAEKIVKSEKVGRKVTLKQAINIAAGKEMPITITAKESQLLKNKLRDMSRAAKTGANYGRVEMRATLNEAFATKLSDLKALRKAVVAYAEELPITLRGGLLNTVASVKTQNDLIKAYARIDAALQNADNKEELQKMKKMAKMVAKAMKTGKGIAVDYQKKIAEVLVDYNLKNPTSGTIKKLNDLSDYIAANPKANIPDYLVKKLDILKKKSPKEMTNENLKDLNDLLGRLWSLGALKMEMKGKYDERYIQKSVDKLLLTTERVEGKFNSIQALYFLHAQRVADIMDGSRNYKGFNSQMQKRVSNQTTRAMQRAEQIIKESVESIAAIKETFTQEEQAIMAFQMAKDQGLFTQAQSLVSAYSDEFGWKSEDDLVVTPEMTHAMDILRGTFASTVDYLAAVYEEKENKPFIKNDNYFPNKYDRNFDNTVDIEAPTINEMQQYIGKQVNKGFTFKRIPNVKKVLRTDIFNVFAEAVSEQQYYIGVQPIINEVASIVSNRDYKNAVGEVGIKWWDRYLKGVANKGRSLNRGIFDQGLAKLRLNISKAVLGYKFTSALLQPTAIIDAYAYVYLNHGVLVANNLIFKLIGTFTIPTYSSRITEKSVALKLRKGGEQALDELSSDISGTRLGRAFSRGGMWALRSFDLKTAAAVQRTMYNHFRKKGMTESEAQKEADFVMNLTQGSSSVGDAPLVLMEGELGKTLLTFQTFVLNRWGLITHDIIKGGLMRGGIGRRLKAVIALFLIMLAGGVDNILRDTIGKLTTGKEYAPRFNFLEQSLLSLPEALPLIGGYITSWVEYGQQGSFPLQRVFQNMVKGGTLLVNPSGVDQTTQDKNRKKGALMLSEAVATMTGVTGSAQAFDIIERMTTPPKGSKKQTVQQDELNIPSINIPDIAVPDINIPDIR